MSENFGQDLARALDVVFNRGARGEARQTGFALFWFEFDKIEGGRVNYVSNADRADMLTAVKEWLARAEGRIQETETKQRRSASPR